MGAAEAEEQLTTTRVAPNASSAELLRIDGTLPMADCDLSTSRKADAGHTLAANETGVVPCVWGCSQIFKNDEEAFEHFKCAHEQVDHPLTEYSDATLELKPGASTSIQDPSTSCQDQPPRDFASPQSCHASDQGPASCMDCGKSRDGQRDESGDFYCDECWAYFDGEQVVLSAQAVQEESEPSLRSQETSPARSQSAERSKLAAAHVSDAAHVSGRGAVTKDMRHGSSQSAEHKPAKGPPHCAHIDRLIFDPHTHYPTETLTLQLCRG